jgi:hypothetical protein
MKIEMKGKLKRAIKDDVLICRKREKKGRVDVWVAAVPDVKTFGKDLASAEQALLEKIWGLCDLDEPIAFRYDDEPKPGQESIVQVAANEVADISEPGQYFENGFCATCQSGLGARNDKVVQLLRPPKATSSAIGVRFQPYFKCGMRVGMTLLHTSLCDKIKSQSRPLLQFREVQVNGKPTTAFLEVVPSSLIPCVIPSSNRGRVGGKCSKCGYQFVFHGPSGKFITKRDEELIREHGAAAIDSHSTPALCVTAAIWGKLSAMKQGPGLLVYPVTGLDEKDISRNPRLEKIVPFKL